MTLQLIASVALVAVASAGQPPATNASSSPSSTTATTTKLPITPSPAPKPETLEEVERRLDVIMNNTRSRENYIRCFTDRGICNREANAIKKVLGDALATNCSACPERERAGAARFVSYLKNKRPDLWTLVDAKYGAAGKGKGKSGGGEAAKEKGGEADSTKGKGKPEAATKAGNASDSETDDDDEEDEEEERRERMAKKGTPAATPSAGSVSVIF